MGGKGVVSLEDVSLEDNTCASGDHDVSLDETSASVASDIASGKEDGAGCRQRQGSCSVHKHEI